MDIDNMTIGQAKELAKMFGSDSKTSTRYEGDLRPVIVRARDAGVHYGKLVAYEGRTVWLKDARRMWKWKAASGVSLSGCATDGIVAKDSKIEAVISGQVILDACEIIDCTPDAAQTIEAA